MVYGRQVGSMLRKAVLAYFAERANDDGSLIYASKRTIACEIECSKQAVITTVKQFVAEGILSESGRHQISSGYTNIYNINLAAVLALPPAKVSINQSTPLTGQEMDQSAPLTGVVNPIVPIESTELTQTVLEPSLNNEANASVDISPPTSAETLTVEHVVEEWNDRAFRMGKPKVRDITPERRKQAKSRIAQYSVDDFIDVMEKVERSAFLRGDTGWHGCTFDWIMKKANFQKIIEGNYDQ